MRAISNLIDEVAEDGHPSEAALEFRRLAIRSKAAKEISADALDLAISFAWIGKAISRTKAMTKWRLAGVDPNTFEFIIALSGAHHGRVAALQDALEAEALTGRSVELKKIRSLVGFQSAVEQVRKITTKHVPQPDLYRLSELARIVELLPERMGLKLRPVGENVVFLQKRKT